MSNRVPHHCSGTNGTFARDFQCALGHTSTLCAACLKGYKMVQDKCKLCEVDLSYTPWLIFYVSMYVSCLLVMHLTVSKKKDVEGWVEDQADALSEIIGTGRILISFLQVFTSLQLTMTVPWKKSFVII